MADPNTMRSRTLVDEILAATLVLLGIYLVTSVLMTSTFSVFAIGLVAIVAGVFSLIEAFLKQRGVRRISGLVSGVLLLVLGILLLINPEAGALSVTLVLALVFLVRGVTSVVLGLRATVGRVVLLIGGLVSIALGVIVLINLSTMTMVLLGILLGIELIVTGATMLATGRRRRRTTRAAAH